MFLTDQLSMVGYWLTMEVMGPIESVFESGEGAWESSTTSKEGNRRANFLILAQTLGRWEELCLCSCGWQGLCGWGGALFVGDLCLSLSLQKHTHPPQTHDPQPFSNVFFLKVFLFRSLLCPSSPSFPSCSHAPVCSFQHTFVCRFTTSPLVRAKRPRARSGTVAHLLSHFSQFSPRSLPFLIHPILVNIMIG